MYSEEREERPDEEVEAYGAVNRVYSAVGATGKPD